MFGKLFRSRQDYQPQRPSIRPVLETLENREVPSSAQTSMAFNQLPSDMNNLEASLAARDVNGINNNLAAVANDMFILKLGAANFVVGDRLRIDSTLYMDGLKLVYDGVNASLSIPPLQYFDIEQVGGAAMAQGYSDMLLTTIFPTSSGTSTLT